MNADALFVKMHTWRKTLTTGEPAFCGLTPCSLLCTNQNKRQKYLAWVCELALRTREGGHGWDKFLVTQVGQTGYLDQIDWPTPS